MKSKRRIIGAIFARGGSKGLPKNIMDLVFSLIAHAITRPANEIVVVVSTDSEEIAMIAREYGADVPSSSK